MSICHWCNNVLYIKSLVSHHRTHVYYYYKAIICVRILQKHACEKLQCTNSWHVRTGNQHHLLTCSWYPVTVSFSTVELEGHHQQVWRVEMTPQCGSLSVAANTNIFLTTTDM